MNEETTIFTIGHSNHSIEKFLKLIQMHSIETLADVRSRPTSRWFPHFRQKALADRLYAENLEYIYLGEQLGGHPSAEEMYDGDDHVVYERLMALPGFRSGIRKVDELARQTRLVLMCSEGQPVDCHRHPLLARVLLEREFKVQHILQDGTLNDATDLFDQAPSLQLPLMEPPGEDLSWKSPKRIKRRK